MSNRGNVFSPGLDPPARVLTIPSLPPNVISFAAAKYAREQKNAFETACREIDQAIADIILIAERAKASIQDESWRYPADGEPAA